MHESENGRFCCKSFFALAIKNSFGRRRDFRVKMWGTTSLPEDKLAGDLGNVIGATSIGGRRSDFFTAGKLVPGNLGLLQQYRHDSDFPQCPLSRLSQERESPTDAGVAVMRYPAASNNSPASLLWTRPGRATCGFLILDPASARGFHRTLPPSARAPSCPAATGTIKWCFTNRTGAQHPPNVGPSAIIPWVSPRTRRARPCCASKMGRGADVRYRGGHPELGVSF
jgi:hypothetical protein